MARGNEMLERLRRLDIRAIVSSVAKSNEQIIADYVRWQMSEGLGRDGKYLPRYQDDPWWRGNIEAALAYRDYKIGISPNPNKPKDVMDLYINGFYYGHEQVKVTGGQIDFFNTADFENEIEQKTGGRQHGLNKKSAKELWSNVMRSPVMTKISGDTGMKINRK